MDRYRKIEIPDEQKVMVGYGSWQDVVGALEKAVSASEWIAGDSFSAADVYAGAQIDWPLQFGMIEPTPALTAYVERLRARDAYKRAKAIDAALVEEAKAAAGD